MYRLVLTILLPLLASCTYYQAAHAEPLTRDEPIVRMVLQEANNEPFNGMVVVAGVALDRISDRRWPDTADAVVYQAYQFTAMAYPLGDYTQKQIEIARSAVRMARLGARPCGPSVFWYHTPAVSPSWSKKLVERCRIGNHIFYGDE